MNGLKRRSKADSLWDRKIGATLAFIRARDALKSQYIFAKRLGITRARLSNIESGRTPLSAVLGWRFCREFDCHPSWICAAGNSNLPNVFPQINDARMEKIENIILISRRAPFRNVWPQIAWLVGDLDEIAAKHDLTKGKAMLDKPPALPDTANVKEIRSLSELLNHVRRLTETRGQKVQLASALGVTRQAVDQFLSGKAKPSAETTFALLNWVKKQSSK
jgi:transcriptional regulator with XRE-family HTH domain